MSGGHVRPTASVTAMVIAKEPRPGKVKTRLCPPCTPEQAAGLAAAALEDTTACLEAAELGTRRLVLEGSPGRWVPAGWEVVPQAGGDLGHRLDAAFAGAGHPALVVGMDTPQARPATIEWAAAALCRPGVDAVLGPATDGGYWLIGFAEPVAGAFDGVPMSAPDTGSRQLARLRRLGLCVAEAPELRDIDRWEDAVAVAGEHPHLRVAAAVAEVAGWQR